MSRKESASKGCLSQKSSTLDGGYGWAILFASFIINVLVDGVCFSFGIFFLEFLDYYHESKQKTSWVGSVLNGMYLSMGPIASALTNKYGCRKVTIVGSFLATLAFSLSIMSPNVDVLILLYGALGGIGFGLMYLPAIVMVGFYFEKKRALATGIAVCGSGIGAFIFAPLSNALIGSYSWKGGTLIIAAIVLNGCIMGAMFRPLELTAPTENVVDNVPNGEACAIPEVIVTDSSVETLKAHRKEFTTRSMDNISNKKLVVSNGNSHHQNGFIKSVDHLWSSANRNKTDVNHLDISRPMYKKDIFYSGSIAHLPSQDQCHDAVDNVIAEEDTSVGRCATLRNMFDLSLLSNPVFLVYGASCFLCMTGFFVPFIYLPDHAKQLNIGGEQAAFLLSILGINNTVGRILSGWVSDQPWADCLLINNCALVIGGVATMMIPFCTSYGLLVAYSCVFGLCIAVFVSLRSIIMVELMGLDKLTSAFGLVTMCQGMSSFIGAPIAGEMYDATGDYNISFYFAGSTISLAGLICFPLRRIAAHFEKKNCKDHI